MGFPPTIVLSLCWQWLLFLERHLCGPARSPACCHVPAGPHLLLPARESKERHADSGVVMEELGLGNLMAELARHVLAPLSNLLYPEWGTASFISLFILYIFLPSYIQGKKKGVAAIICMSYSLPAVSLNWLPSYVCHIHCQPSHSTELLLWCFLSFRYGFSSQTATWWLDFYTFSWWSCSCTSACKCRPALHDPVWLLALPCVACPAVLGYHRQLFRLFHPPQQEAAKTQREPICFRDGPPLKDTHGCV